MEREGSEAQHGDKRRGRAALAGLGLATLLAAFATSSANVALPALADGFGIPFHRVQWVVLAYLLALTSLVLVAGRLGDRLGRRRILLAGLGLFACSSQTCAAASAFWLLLAGRLGQGVGAAAMMALSLSLAGETIGKDGSGRAMGLLGSLSAVGTALGPSLGGVLLGAWGWPSLFWIAVPLALLAMLLVRGLPEDRAATDEAGRIDPIAALLLAAAIAAYALAMTLGRAAFSGFNLLLPLCAATALALFLRRDGRSGAPILPLAGLREPGLRAGLATSALVATVMMASLVVGPFYLSRGYGLSPAQIGLILSIGPVCAAVGGLPAGILADRLGERALALAGLAALAGGSLMLALLPAAFGLAAYVAAILVLTLGYAFFQTANNKAVMAAAGKARRGTVAGLLNLSRNLGLITGASLMGAIFAAIAGDVATAPRQAVALGLTATFGIAAALMLIAFAILAAPALKRAREAGAGRRVGRRQFAGKCGYR